jgi:hypothetical protein
MTPERRGISANIETSAQVPIPATAQHLNLLLRIAIAPDGKQTLQIMPVKATQRNTY